MIARGGLLCEYAVHLNRHSWFVLLFTWQANTHGTPGYSAVLQHFSRAEVCMCVFACLKRKRAESVRGSVVQLRNNRGKGRVSCTGLHEGDMGEAF